jgi:predicted dinucleotide-binding enzyme
MNIAALGTGTVGRTIAGKLSELGHEVLTGTRDSDATLARTEPAEQVQRAFPAARVGKSQTR